MEKFMMGNFSSRQTEQTTDEDIEDNALYDEPMNIDGIGQQFDNQGVEIDSQSYAEKPTGIVTRVYTSTSSSDVSNDSDDTASSEVDNHQSQQNDTDMHRNVSERKSQAAFPTNPAPEKGNTVEREFRNSLLENNEGVAWEVDVTDFKKDSKTERKGKKIPKGRKREEQWKKVRVKHHEPYTPPSVTITHDEMLRRRVLDQTRWFCMSRPQYSKSCGMSSLVSCWNYLFSTLGNGSLQPITQEEALTIFGFKPPFNDIRFGPFTGNATLMRWFRQLNDHFGVRGRSHYLYKPHGKGRTMGRTPAEALKMVKEGLKDPNTTFIYHCHNHYFCPIGFEDVPKKAADAYRSGLKDSELDTWILVGDPSRKHAGVHFYRWEDISLDVNCQLPEFVNIRKLHLGKQTCKAKKTGGNLHCIMTFKRSLFQVKNDVKPKNQEDKNDTGSGDGKMQADLEENIVNIYEDGAGDQIMKSGKKITIEDVEQIEEADILDD